MKTVFAAVLCLFAALPARGEAPQEFTGIRRVDLRISSGNVKVTGVAGDRATLEVAKKRYDERCRLTVEQRGDLLYVELASKSLFSARCEADFQLQVPRSVGLKFKDGSGNIAVNGTSGPMAVETGSGRVDVKAKLSAFEARTGSGAVRAEGLRSPATVRTGSGSVRLVYDSVPADGQLEIRSGSGDAEVLFPKHAHVRTAFTAGSGRVNNQLGESPNARFTVSMKTGSGDLMVGKF
ncbi:MAG: DUF4097 family beta strand repeat-containing protein [Bdellovibrionota bacterium]